MREIVVDCTELCHNPLRSGIQRVVRELLRRWPVDKFDLCAARFDRAQGLVRLPPAATDLLVENDPATRTLPIAKIQQRLSAIIDRADALAVPRAAPVLIPESFYDPGRCQFYEERLATDPGGLAMFAHDFLAYLRPDLFPFKGGLNSMPYLRLISRASSVAFNSDQTREEFAARILRVSINDPRIGPVVPLGADGLPMEQQVWRSGRRQYVCIGSLDGRKNQEITTAAFIRLWEAGREIPLVLIGRKFEAEGGQFGWLDRARTFPQFRWLNMASDDDIATAMRDARATIFLSSAEGFGLPPVESLYVGVPVITTANVPSVTMLPRLGQIRLPELSVEAVEGAVLALEDDQLAARLWIDAAELDLSTWKIFAAQIVEWCATLRPNRENSAKKKWYRTGLKLIRSRNPTRFSKD